LSRELATVRADLDLGLTLDELAVAPIRRDELLAFAKRWEIRRLEQVANELGVAEAEAGAPAPQRPAERRGTAAEQASPERDGTGATATVEVPVEFGVGTIARPKAPLPASLAGEQGDLFAAAGAEAGEAASLSLGALAERVHE